MVQRTRLRVDGVHGAAFDEETADTSVHEARFEILAVRIEDLDPVIAAIRHPQAPSRIEHQRVRRAELAVAHADRAP